MLDKILYIILGAILLFSIYILYKHKNARIVIFDDMDARDET